MRSFFKRTIFLSFYLLFFLVPIIFTSNTSELFELNKMWLTFGLTLIIAASWISIMFLDRKIKILKTPLDIPILLFLFSQVLSTIFSIDPHTSIWGYYSRFNGGLLSLFDYAFLYFAFINNVEQKDVLKYIFVSIASAIFVALWGLPSHFGYDPTCLIFRGTFDVSCWTSAFQPKVRIFSTLGQPDWLAAYLAFWLMVVIGFSIIYWQRKKTFLALLFLAITALFYADLIYSGSRSGFGAFGFGFVLFLAVYVIWQWKSLSHKNLGRSLKQHTFFVSTIVCIAVVTFLIGAPVSPLSKVSLSNVVSIITSQNAVKKVQSAKQPVALPTQTPPPTQELGGTDSLTIRKYVWEGALQIFLHHPILGTGVETFAYSYYQFRPAAHNLTSEWDYLYNKAHNEFLNYLATTGIVGFGTYMAFLIMSMYLMVRAMRKADTIEEQKHAPLFASPFARFVFPLAMLTGYVTILITNFFGFSVVIINIYLFLMPACVLLFNNLLSEKNMYLLGDSAKSERPNEVSWIGSGIAWILCIYFLIVLYRFWIADTAYAMGQHLDQANDYQDAYTYLHQAVSTRPSEPTFQDELSINDSVLAAALYQQKEATAAAQLTNEAIAVSNQLVTQHQYVVTYWKDRVRIFYTLAQINPSYLSTALTAIEQAANLAPTDAKVWYNLGLLYDQTGNLNQAITVMQRTIQLKDDYTDAYYALALFYRQAAVGKDGKTITNPIYEKKAVDQMHLTLEKFGPNPKITDTLSSWGEK